MYYMKNLNLFGGLLPDVEEGASSLEARREHEVGGGEEREREPEAPLAPFFKAFLACRDILLEIFCTV